jgi:putative membrane fusion protein
MLKLFNKAKKKIFDFLKLDNKKQIWLKRILPGTIATVLGVVMIIVTVYHSTDGFTTLIDVEPASIVHESESMTFTAYMLKDEKVLTSKYSGGVLYRVKNAGRVNPGDVLADVYSQPVDESIQKRAETLDLCIEILEKSIVNDNFTAGEPTEVMSELSKLYYEIERAISSGDASIISSGYGELLTLLNKMHSYAGNGDEVKQMLEEYKAKREELSEFYTGDFTTEKTTEGGYFFKESDGYEDVFNSANIDEMTYDTFLEMTQMKPSESKGFGKIMRNYLWYLAVPTVKGVSDSYVIGQSYSVKFPDADNRTLAMTLSDVIYDQTNSKSIMLFSCGVVDASFDYLRIQRVEIISKNVSGFRIPASAVCEVSGVTGVYILKDGRATFRKITVLYEGDGYYIVSADYTANGGYYVYIELNDSIITDPKNMYEGKVIE